MHIAFHSVDERSRDVLYTRITTSFWLMGIFILKIAISS
jgi:hypothetical protein